MYFLKQLPWIWHLEFLYLFDFYHKLIISKTNNEYKNDFVHKDCENSFAIKWQKNIMSRTVPALQISAYFATQ